MYKIYKSFLLIVICFAIALLSSSSFAESKDKGSNGKKLSKTTGVPNHTKLNINNISTFIYNNGDSDLDLLGNAGFQYPKGSGKTAIFESGLIWGAKVNGVLQVGGSTYNHGVQPGKILSPGVAEDPNLAKNRIYRVRPDFKTANLASAAADEGLSETDIYNQYQTDWNEWPAAEGAPFDDKDGNGVYDPNIDIPGVPGASQTVWFVANDLDQNLTTKLYGSNPMGIEMQATMWAYSQAGPLSNMIFRRYVIINKSETAFNDMIVTMWSDPDNGDATDDFAGCDTTLSLGFCYNSKNNDAVYGELPPPATGFDFFQGPVVPGTAKDSAIFKGKVIHGKKNLPMTAFFYFDRTIPALEDPVLGSYEGTIQMYNFMQGRIGKTGQFFVTPEGKPTTFANTGDPVTGTGWLDGTQSPAGDRRLGLSSGPFTMAAGDTQEVVVAEIAAEGSDRLQSVKLLKSYDARAQQAYNNFFKIPTGAAPPVVQATELNREVVLSWGDPINAEKTESYNANGYKFQGYNVYQLPSPSAGKDESKLIATFDLVDQVSTIYDYVFDPRTGKPELTPVQFGTNSGIKRSFVVNKDYLNGNVPLNNGSRYYYAVTSYSFNPDSGVIPNVLENPLSSITVTPHALNPGVRYPAITGDTLKTVVHRAGSSDASVTPLIVDPSKLTGHSYKVTFQVFKVPDPATGGIRDSVVWAVFDSTANKYVEQNQNNISGNANYFIFDGIQLIVQGPPPGMKDFAIPSGTRKWSFSGGNFNLEGFSGAIGNAYNNWFSGSTVTPDKLYDVLIKFATTDSLGNITDQNDPNASFAYRYLRRASQPPRYPSFAPFIKNKTAGYAFQDYTKTMPFAAYNAVTNQRLMVGYLENNDTLGTVDGKYWPPSTDEGTDNTAATGPREWFFIFDVPYSTTPDTALEKDILNTTLPIAWMGTPTRRGAASVAFSSNDQFLIISNKLISASDVFSFTTPPVTSGNTAYALEDVKMINVFPNPYYGVNPQEINKYQRFVTFSHLPQTATIRIFNVAGQLVRTIARDNSASQFERWDLNNENGLPVGSGMYIAHIDMGPLGSKILKLAVIQEQQVLDRF